MKTLKKPISFFILANVCIWFFVCLFDDMTFLQFFRAVPPSTLFGVLMFVGGLSVLIAPFGLVKWLYLFLCSKSETFCSNLKMAESYKEVVQNLCHSAALYICVSCYFLLSIPLLSLLVQFAEQYLTFSKHI